MKKLLWVLFALSFCGTALAAKKAPDHWYSLKDGQEYGYQKGVTAQDAAEGTVAGQLLMIKYAGLHDGADQLFAKEGPAVVVLECKRPCKFIKEMTFVSGQFIKKNYIADAFGSLGWAMMADAEAGKLQPYMAKKNGKRYHLWFDEEDGVHFVPVKGK